MRRPVRAALALALLAVPRLQAQGDPRDAVYAAFRDGYARLDAAAVANLYHEDALYLAPGDPPVRGRAAIEAIFRGFFDRVRADGGTLHLEFRLLERQLAEGQAADVGYYRLAVVKEGQRGRPSVGRFVTVLRPGRDGRWRFAVDAYTGAKPEEYDAAPPRDP